MASSQLSSESTTEGYILRACNFCLSFSRPLTALSSTSKPILNFVWNLHCNINLEAITRLVSMTQTTRNGIAQAAKRQHATDMHISFENDPMSLVVSCFLGPWKMLFKEAKEEGIATKTHLSHVVVLKLKTVLQVYFRIAYWACHTVMYFETL